MKKILLAAFSFVLLLSSFDAGAQRSRRDWTTTTRDVPAFTKIEVESGIDVYISDGTPGVTIYTRQNVHDNVEVSVSDGTLYLKHKSNFLSGSDRDIRARVTTNALTSVKASEDSDVELQNFTTAGNFSFEGTGGSSIEGTVNCDELFITLENDSDAELNVECNNIIIKSGRDSDIELKGRADSCTAEVSGGGDLEAYGLSLRTLSIDFRNGADGEVTVSESITGSLSSSKLSYRGNPSVDVRRSGNSRLEAR